MFFSLSLATYYTLSSLIRNGKTFLGFRQVHYVLPSGSFGFRPPFKDHKRKPPSREFPIEDVSFMSRSTPERTLFLDEIYKNFLDLTLTDQQEIFVDFLMKELENCLHRGLTPNIIFNDVDRFSSLDSKNDPDAVFVFDGDFGILLSPTGENTHDAEATQQLAATITSYKLSTPKGTSYALTFPGLPTSSRNDNFFIPRRSGTTYPFVNAAYHQSLTAAVVGSAKYPHSVASAPARYRFGIQRKTLDTTVSFYRRTGHCISYLSIPVTFRVTKFSFATNRNCVSLICNVNQSTTSIKAFVQKSLAVPESANIRPAGGFNNTGSKYSLLLTSIDNNYPQGNIIFHQSLPVVEAGCAKLVGNVPSAPARYKCVVQRKYLNIASSFCRRLVQYISYRSLPGSFRVTKIFLAEKRKCLSLIICKVNLPKADRTGLDNGKKKFFFQKSLDIVTLPRNSIPCDERVGETIFPLHSLKVTPDIRAGNSCQRLNNFAQINSEHIRPDELGKTTTLHHAVFKPFNNATSSALSQKKQDPAINYNVNHRLVPVSSGRLTPIVLPTLPAPCPNRPTGGKVAAAPLGMTGLVQNNQERNIDMNFGPSSNSPTFMVASNTGQSVSNLRAGAIGGQANPATDFNDPFGWGKNTSWGNGGLYQPHGSTHSRGGFRNPIAEAMNGAVNTKSPPGNRNKQVQQGASWATLLDASKPCSPTKISVMGHRPNHKHSSYHLLNDQVFSQASPSSIWVTDSNFVLDTAQGENRHSSYRLLNSITPNQAAKPTIARNNSGRGLTQQAAGLGFMPWEASPVNPSASSGAIPKTSSKTKPKVFSKRPSFHNSKDSNKYYVPASCPEIPWSDLEDVIDRRTRKPKILGSGSFGIVKLMKQKSSGKMCAVKLNQDDVDKQTVIENLQLEIDVLTTLKNLECVPELYGVTKPGNDSSPPVIVQEFIGDPNTFRSMTLAIAIRAKVLPPHKAKRVALRVCEALRDLHSRRLLHCDLKVDNVMLEPGFVRKDNPKVKIIDFGASVKMDDNPCYQYNTREQMLLILKWSGHIAPEVVRGERPYNVSSEVYGLGVILKDISFRFRGFLWKIGEECTDADYTKRPSVEDVIQRIKTHLTSIQGAANRLAAP